MDWEVASNLRFNANVSRTPKGYPAASACRPRDLQEGTQAGTKVTSSVHRNTIVLEIRAVSVAVPTSHSSLKGSQPTSFSRDAKLKHCLSGIMESVKYTKASTGLGSPGKLCSRPCGLNW